MALTTTPPAQLGDAAPTFVLPGVDGRRWDLDAARGSNGLLVMFICNHCPYVKSIREKLVRDCEQLKEHGIGSIAIMANDPSDYPEDSFENMGNVARQYAYPFPYVIDSSQQVARAYGAVCTPDFFGYDRNLRLRYRGRLDAAGAKRTNEPMRRDLYEAMVEVAETGTTTSEQIPSIGCSIKWK